MWQQSAKLFCWMILALRPPALWPQYDVTVRPSVTSSSLNAGVQKALLSIACVDSYGYIIPKCDITFTLAPVAMSGGHDHDNADRPRGHVVYPGTETDMPGGNSGSSGYLDFDYIAPEVSGQVNMTATGVSTDPPGIPIQPRTFAIGVSIPGLVAMPATGTGYQFVTSTYHSQNHRYGTADFNSRFWQIPGLFAFRMRDYLPNETPDLLQYTSNSLPLGGLYDVFGNKFLTPSKNWAPPHKSHRFGTDADIFVKPILEDHRAHLAWAVRASCLRHVGGYSVDCFGFPVPTERPSNEKATVWHIRSRN